ncbi:MAG: DUF4394 domain-containing protein [Rariglobus sp.]
MKLNSFLSLSAGLAALLVTAGTAHAQTAYGVNAAGSLFSFNLATPGSITTLGNLGFTPEAIDFRPGTSTLYAVDVNSTTGVGNLYTVNTSTGAATVIGSGFSAATLIGATSIAFDFNPTTLQGDTTIRIRFVASNGSNFRLNSGTATIANTDGTISGVANASVTGAAYTNSNVAVAPGGGSTALYYIDSFNNTLLVSSDPNAGTVAAIGPLGFDIGTDVGFDIVTGGSVNTAYIVNSSTTSSLYTVDLATGATTFVGNIASNFAGGFAIDQLSAIPEPSTYAAILGAVGITLAASRRRQRA